MRWNKKREQIYKREEKHEMGLVSIKGLVFKVFEILRKSIRKVAENS